MRKQEAKERQAKRNELGDAGQLVKLNKLGYAATRERIRILSRMERGKG